MGILNKVFKAKNTVDKDYIEALNGYLMESWEDRYHKVKMSRDMYDGYQWEALHTEGGLIFNSKGNAVHGRWEDIVQRTEDFPYQLITHNLIKPSIERRVAQFVEVNPLPRSKPKYEEARDAEKLKKQNLVLEEIFRKENKLKNIYEESARSALRDCMSIVQIYISEEESSTEVPVIIKNIDVKEDKFYIDPDCQDINDARFIKHTITMKRMELEEKYAIRKDWLENSKYNNPTSYVEIDHWWFRFKSKKEVLWTLVPIFDGNYCPLKGKDGTKLNMDNHIFPVLPYVQFRVKAMKKQTDDTPLIMEVSEAQMQYNYTLTMEQYNYEMFTNPSYKVYGNDIDDEDVEDLKIPGTIVRLQPGQEARPNRSELTPDSYLDKRLRQKEDVVKSAYGDPDLAEGRRPTGVYANSMLQTLISLNNVEPKKIESLFKEALVELANKSLILWAEYQGSKSIELFDAEAVKMSDDLTEVKSVGEYVKITGSEILDVRNEIYIEVQDTNLMTPEAKLQNLNQFMQYAGGVEGHPFYIPLVLGMMEDAYNNYIPNYALEMAEKFALLSAKKQNLELVLANKELEQKVNQMEKQDFAKRKQEVIKEEKNKYNDSEDWTQLEENVKILMAGLEDSGLNRLLNTKFKTDNWAMDFVEISKKNGVSPAEAWKMINDYVQEAQGINNAAEVE
jgi:hypothetical protein